MRCIKCNSEKLEKCGNHNGLQRYKCLECNKRLDGEKYEDKKIIHFNTKIDKKDTNLLTRENYCVPTAELSYKSKKIVKSQRKIITIPNEKYADEEHYTDSYVEKHYKRCMENFDLNMEYFSKINYDEFNEYLLNFVKRYGFDEVNDLNVVKDVYGLYILVLDKYKQVYIGKSVNKNYGIKGEILAHWTKRKEFDRLIYRKLETSIISIDSFGALDTTRIFYKEVKISNIDKEEEKMVAQFNANYRLNRVAGGINDEQDKSIRDLKLFSSIQKRNLKN